MLERRTLRRFQHVLSVHCLRSRFIAERAGINKREVRKAKVFHSARYGSHVSFIERLEKSDYDVHCPLLLNQLSQPIDRSTSHSGARSLTHSLIVLTPRLSAFCAAEEANFAFVCRTQLSKPPIRCVVPTLGTMSFDCGHTYRTFTLNYKHSPFVARYLVHPLVRRVFFLLLGKTTLATLYVALVRDHYAFTLRTKLHVDRSRLTGTRFRLGQGVLFGFLTQMLITCLQRF